MAGVRSSSIVLLFFGGGKGGRWFWGGLKLWWQTVFSVQSNGHFYLLFFLSPSFSMTVEEHMEFYGGVKGHLSTLETKREIRKWVDELLLAICQSFVFYLLLDLHSSMSGLCYEAQHIRRKYSLVIASCVLICVIFLFLTSLYIQFEAKSHSRQPKL